MTSQQNKLLHRGLAVALLLFVMLLLALLIIMPIVSKGLELNESKNNLLFTLQKYQNIVAKKDAVMASMDNIKQQHAEQGYLNSQKTDALASADMQELIKAAIVDAGGSLSSTQSLPVDNSKDKFKRVMISVRMTGNSEVLRSVLYKLETATPLIVINEIDIRPMRGRRNMKTRQIEPSNDLNVNFQAVGFMSKSADEQ